MLPGRPSAANTNLAAAVTYGTSLVILGTFSVTTGVTVVYSVTVMKIVERSLTTVGVAGQIYVRTVVVPFSITSSIHILGRHGQVSRADKERACSNGVIPTISCLSNGNMDALPIALGDVAIRLIRGR